MLYLALKYLHIIGAAVLLGTGAGIAFFMAMAHRSGEPELIAGTACIVVIADCLFTASAVVLQPITGIAMAQLAGYSVFDGWIAVSIVLYIVIGLFWLPVIWMQIRMRDLTFEAVRTHSALPPEYHRLFKLWFACGIPAFAAILVVVWLMIARPSLSVG